MAKYKLRTVGLTEDDLRPKKPKKKKYKVRNYEHSERLNKTGSKRYTKQDKELIIKMFERDYLTDNEKSVNNTSVYISDTLEIGITTVNYHITKHLAEKERFRKAKELKVEYKLIKNK